MESDYAKYIKQILKGMVNNNNLSFLSYFVVLQYMRVEAFIDMFQGSMDKVAGWMDDFKGKDDYKTYLKDIAKRQLATVDFGDIVHPHAAIIYNETNFPFITSDNPVVRRQINISDALKIIPKKYLSENINESIEFALFFIDIHRFYFYAICVKRNVSSD